MRIELKTKSGIIDSRTKSYADLAEKICGIRPSEVSIVDVYLVGNEHKVPTEALKEIFQDNVAQDIWLDEYALDTVQKKPELMVEISWKPGVTDPVAITARAALSRERGSPLGLEIAVQTARQLWFTFGKNISSSAEDALCRALFNPLIQREERIRSSEYKKGTRFPSLYKGVAVSKVEKPLTFDVATMSDSELLTLSKDRLLALTLEEMLVIKAHYSDAEVQKQRAAAGLGKHASDVELEMLAQSWSEHCKHKIFAAEIEYSDITSGTKEKIPGLFKTYIRDTTKELSKDRSDLRSVFHDNAGVVDFDDEHVVCFKVETHNSPSALDPYGGAITGIVGVNRDILGTGKGASPIFNTNYLCFADPETKASEVPTGLLHPARIMHGVHEGIIDGGNQSGIPTVGGGFLFDETYIGKPLVFCGTGGIMPRSINGEVSWVKHVDAGDYAVMVGGRIGKDGIHGATFSSLALDENSPNSAVQIGDPITQRRVWDFLIEARDKGLYKGITDNGAGGLSSSLGEMSQASGGLRVDLDRCPLKYPGLAPWEIWVSESQERMSLSVDPEMHDEFQKLAKKHHVEATVVGVFTNSGNVELYYDDEAVAFIPLNFLHDGLPPMRLKAVWPLENPLRIKKSDFRLVDRKVDAANAKKCILQVLAHPNVRSKETLVRKYDHEVQAHNQRPSFRGKYADAPADGALLCPVPGSTRGLSVTHGVCPRVGDTDTYWMAVLAFDEAYRSHIALGGDPDLASALDNFCWPDPVQSDYTPDGEFKLAQLVRANKGLRDACLAYNAPLVSGKDSMKNDARLGGKKISIRPTLLVSIMGIVPDSRYAPASGFVNSGSTIVGLGKASNDLGGSVFEHCAQLGALKDYGINDIDNWGAAPQLDLTAQSAFYKRLYSAIRLGLIESIHDISDGGLITALLESSFHHRIGFDITLDGDATVRQLFSEAPGNFVCSIKTENYERLVSVLGQEWVRQLGRTIAEDRGVIRGTFAKAKAELVISLTESITAWKKGW